MSQAIITLLVSHIITFIESELIKNEPKAVEYLIHDIQSLIAKLELLIASKSPTAAKVATPVLNAVQTIADDALEAGGTAIVESANNQSNAA